MKKTIVIYTLLILIGVTVVYHSITKSETTEEERFSPTGHPLADSLIAENLLPESHDKPDLDGFNKYITQLSLGRITYVTIPCNSFTDGLLSS